MSNGASSSANGSSTVRNILLTGQKQAGKTSCLKVLFENASVDNLSWTIPPTTEVQTTDVDLLGPVRFYECPGTWSFQQIKQWFPSLAMFSTVIYVQDMQNITPSSVELGAQLLVECIEANANVDFNVFCHKLEDYDSDIKQESYRQVQEQFADEIEDQVGRDTDLYTSIHYHLTSVYNSSLSDAMSKVMMGLVLESEAMQGLVKSWASNSNIDSAFLFQTKHCIYLAKDDSPMDSDMFALMCVFLRKNTALRYLWYELHAKSPRKTFTQTMEERTGRMSLNGSSVVDDDDEVFPAQFAGTAEDTIMGCWQVTDELSLIAMVKKSWYQDHREQIGENLDVLRRAVKKMRETAQSDD